MITNAQGRDILEIDGCLASNIFLDWTGLSLPLKTKELAQYSLAFNDRLVDVMGISKDGVLNCYASTAADLGHCQVSILSIKPSDVIGAIKQVARAAKESVGFDVRGVLVSICAGTSTLFSDDDLRKLQVNLREVAPEVLAVFSLGEQGNSRSGEDAFHGNHMLNFLFFG